MAAHLAFTRNCSSSSVSDVDPLSSASEFDVTDLVALSGNLEAVFQSPEYTFCADARIIIAGPRAVPVHRCVLIARSSFFRSVFGAAKANCFELELKEWARDFEIGYDTLMCVLFYLYTGRVRLPSDGICSCVDEDCPHVACRPVVDFMGEMLYAAFTFQIAELVLLYQRCILNILPEVAIDDVLRLLSVANVCRKACTILLSKCIESVAISDLDNVTIGKTLPLEISKHIFSLRAHSSSAVVCGTGCPIKHMNRVYRALDSDDVQLVRMLLNEEHTNLDESYALHYAVAFCDPSTVSELLDLELGDVNHRSPRGLTVLHVAAIRGEPKVVLSLLIKGACFDDLTLDGRKPIQISKRITKMADYCRPLEEGKATSNNRLCIEILEQSERRGPQLEEASFSPSAAGYDLRTRLLYLESRVGLAKLLFPSHAKVVMGIAQVDGTSEFPLASNFENGPRIQNQVADFNDAPFKIRAEYLIRLRALSRTVELAKRYFPRCSLVLDRLVDSDDLASLTFLDFREQTLKKRFREIQDMLEKAFSDDDKDNKKSVVLSSSTSHVNFSRTLVRR